MKVEINIQSYKRAGNVTTLNFCPNANLWVHSFEIEEYKKEYPQAKIMELPDSTRGNLSKVKNFILDYWKDSADAILFLDDDMDSINYWNQTRPVSIDSEEELIAMIEKYSFLCGEWGFKLWGINLNPDKQCYREYSPFSTLSYVSSSFACFLKGNELRYDENLPLKEDYDMTIQQCLKYRGLLRVNKFFYIKKSAENVGGCASIRSVEREEEQFNLLQQKWGSRIVKKEKLSNSLSHSSKKVRKFDINPIINIPIKGI